MCHEFGSAVWEKNTDETLHCPTKDIFCLFNILYILGTDMFLKQIYRYKYIIGRYKYIMDNRQDIYGYRLRLYKNHIAMLTLQYQGGEERGRWRDIHASDRERASGTWVEGEAGATGSRGGMKDEE